MYCLDASVLVNAYLEKEELHQYSKKLVELIKSQKKTIFLPEIIFPEIASAVSRGIHDSNLAIEFISELRRLPNFTIIPIDSEVSTLAAKLAATYKLRGCDAIYVAVAYLFRCRLITLDKQQRDKTPKEITVLTPQEELKTVS